MPEGYYVIEKTRLRDWIAAKCFPNMGRDHPALPDLLDSMLSEFAQMAVEDGEVGAAAILAAGEREGRYVRCTWLDDGLRSTPCPAPATHLVAKRLSPPGEPLRVRGREACGQHAVIARQAGYDVERIADPPA